MFQELFLDMSVNFYGDSCEMINKGLPQLRAIFMVSRRLPMSILLELIIEQLVIAFNKH